MAATVEAEEIAERWKAIGGTTEVPAGQKGNKKKMIFVSPDGEKLDSVKKASEFLKERNGKPDAPASTEEPKRAAESAEPADDDGNKENSKKKAKKARVEKPAPDAAAAAEAAAVGSGRRAAQGDKSYKEPALPRGGRGGKADMVVKVEERIVATEAAALEETGGAAGTGQIAKRRLFDFSVVDETGQVQPLERLNLTSAKLKITGIVQPAEGEASRETGRKVEGLGPITDWSIRYSRAEGQVVVHTASAQYSVGRPATAYRKLFTQLEEQVAICHQVFLCLSPECGGNLQSSLDEVAAKLARAKVGKSYANAREALLLNAKFVLNQLEAMAAPPAKGAAPAAVKAAGAAFTNSSFGVALAAEVAKGPANVSLMSNGIRIVEPQAKPAGAAPDALAEADEDMARRLQAKLDAEQHAGGGGRARGGAAGGGRGSGGGAAYIRISEEEIADDYPAPLPYDKTEEETDELVLADDECMLAPEDLPRRLLHDFAIYNSEGLFASLELLPMWGGADSDIELFASGVVTEDEGDWATGGQAASSTTVEAEAGGSAGAGGSSSAAAQVDAGGAAAGPAVPAGMRMYLSQIREWVVEFSCDLIFISCRTDVAWYRLVTPVAKYGPWFRTVLKSAQVAVSIIGMLSEESRASRLSFNDVVKRLVEEAVEKTSAFISKKAEMVERFVVVHGQIILNQIANFPNKSVQRSAFVGMLRQKMESRRHCKLYMSKAKPIKGVKGRNTNPMKNRAATGRPRPMNATATTMVKAVWQSYFIAGQKGEAEGSDAAAAPVAQEVEDDENAEEDDNDVVENALAVAPIEAPASQGKKAAKKGKKPSAKVQWVGGSTSTDSAGRVLYARAKLAGGDNTEVALGDTVALDFDEDALAEHAEAAAAAAADGADAAPAVTPVRPLGLVQCLYQDAAGDRMVQVRRLFRGPETVLGDAGNEFELYLTNEYETRSLSEVAAKVCAKRLARPWGTTHRLDAFKEDEARRLRNEARRAEGSLAAAEYVYRMLYRPEAGHFSAVDDATIVTGAYHEEPAAPVALGVTSAGGLIKAGVTYAVGDFLFLHREAWSMAALRSGGKEEGDEDDSEEAEDDEEEAGPSVPAYAAKSGRHKGSNRGLKAFKIGQLLAVATRGKDNQPATITVRPFLRPEDCSAELAYKSAWWEVYAPAQGTPAWAGLKEVDVADVVCKCSVVLPGTPGSRLAVNPRQTGLALSTFVVTHSVDPATPASSLTDAPRSLKVEPAPAAGSKAAAKGKGKAKCKAAAEDVEMTDAAASKKGKGEASAKASTATSMEEDEEEEEPSAVAMKTMDIFAGCGGLSEGMHQAGVADSRWAIEYEQPAADAFQLNNPDAKVFCNNCNVLLQAAMAKAGLSADCDACEDAVEAAGRLSAEDVAALPLPGDVEFIMGGPPCQGYSGMNRFNKGNWSMVQNSMVMAFLSYCDFYRPRYFLLENVRNFVSHNKSFTFRLTLRTLLEMGYQVRFGVLNAGNFGVPQSRKRTIIWAAAPGETLPEWPTPRHVFHSPQLKINLPNGVTYCAVPDLPGAPLRAVTVKDAIADLPPIENGDDRDEQPYVSEPASAFQRFIRGSSTVLHDHICKEMNELNLERCRCIPKNVPGADWRVLQEIVAADPSREKYKGAPLVPWCLPNTADRHNGWRGLFGRLDLAGHFPTSTTDPQPMGKVGQVFHPTQDRIVSVRECARAQGFPDHFRYSGNVHNRHRQVGNAVPPPLAAALGGQLRVVLDKQREEQIARSMAEQFGA